MTRDIIKHEIQNILTSSKFLTVFIAVSVLVVLSILLGIGHYKKSVAQYETVVSLTEQEMRGQKGWLTLTNRIARKPDPLQIFINGVNDDIGRYSAVGSNQPVKLTNSTYTDEPVYAIFRFIDFSFIITIALSLIALVFTYDSVNGETENGTLRLVFANPVSRIKFFLAKSIGIWLGLLAIVLVPLLLSLLLLPLFSIAMSAGDWLRVGQVYFFSLLLFTFFIVFGTLTSTLTRRSQVSFLISLVFWITMVFVVPRAGVLIASQSIRLPSIAEIEGIKDSKEKELWTDYEQKSAGRWAERQKAEAGMNEEQQMAYHQQHKAEWMEAEEIERKKTEQKIENAHSIIMTDLRNRQLVQQNLALNLARLSPVTAFQLAVMNVAGTDIDVKYRYEEALRAYREKFNAYKDVKAKTSGNSGGIQITMSSSGGMQISAGRGDKALDLSGIPRFTYSSASLPIPVADGAIVVCWILAACGAVFWFFLRYDLR